MEEHPQDGSGAEIISRSAVQLLHAYTGRGPTRARTTINHDSVMIVLGDTLTQGERKLAESGKADRVLDVRHDFQMVMRDELVATVERRGTAPASGSDAPIAPDESKPLDSGSTRLPTTP